MHLLFLSTNNLTTNPRLYKEIRAALQAGYNVTVAMFYLGNWSDTKNDQLLAPIQSSKLTIIQLDATSSNKISWFFWGILEIKARLFSQFLSKKPAVQALASNRRSMQLLWACRYMEQPVLIIAHNLGALYPAHKLSKKWQIPFIFDVEDYHPGEFIRKDAKNEKERRKFLMRTLLPKAAALTSASPLIGQYTLNLIGGHPNHNVILNGFPKKEFIRRSLNSNKQNESLKLVWFSQKISFGRGLEQLFEALIQLSISSSYHESKHLLLSLTLIGDIDTDFFQQIIQPFNNLIENTPKTNSQFHHISTKETFQKQQSIQLTILPPLAQKELHQHLDNYDIGLALEPGKDLNNHLAISNKIIAYSQAGLYILATNTPAQKAFIAEDSERGICCKPTANSISKALMQLSSTSNEIKSKCTQRYQNGQSLAWENESSKLISVWEFLIK